MSEDGDQPIHTLNVTFDQLLAVGGVYSNYVNCWFTQHEITLDFLTQRGGPPSEGVHEATLVARVKVAPSALGPMIQQIASIYEAWIDRANSAEFSTVIAPHQDGDDNE